MKIKFEEDSKTITCIVTLATGKKYAKTERIKKQADRVDSIKKAKQQTFIGCMAQALGYVCDRVNNIDEI